MATPRASVRAVDKTDLCPRAEGPVLSRANWQMSHGERMTFEGLLAQTRPKLAVEIGTAEGGSLDRLAHYSEEVHSFDLTQQVDHGEFPNVTFHLGDNHILLPELLMEFEREGRNVDFVLVDGDHSAAGVRTDVEQLLASGAVRNTFILLHDTMNEEVFEGLNAVDYSAYPNIVFFDLAFTQSFHTKPQMLREAWCGLGLIVVDTDGVTGVAPRHRDRRRGPLAIARYCAWHVLRPVRTIHRRARQRGRASALGKSG